MKGSWAEYGKGDGRNGTVGGWEGRRGRGGG